MLSIFPESPSLQQASLISQPLCARQRGELSGGRAFRCDAYFLSFFLSFNTRFIIKWTPKNCIIFFYPSSPYFFFLFSNHCIKSPNCPNCAHETNKETRAAGVEGVGRVRRVRGRGGGALISQRHKQTNKQTNSRRSRPIG